MYFCSMIISIEWMKEWFDNFNHEYFNDLLPTPEFRLMRARTRLGQMAYSLRFYRIGMTTYYDFTDRQAKEVLLHEMIHYFIAYKKLRDTSSHGIVFRSIASNFRRKYGWDIRVRYRGNDLKVNNTTLKNNH